MKPCCTFQKTNGFITMRIPMKTIFITTMQLCQTSMLIHFGVSYWHP